MHLNYIILAHHQPEQLKRLINSLQTEIASFYIHIDKKTDIVPFRDALRGIQNIFILKDEDRVDVIWGDISTIQATLNAMQRVIETSSTGYCILLSGQDYPIKSIDYITSFFEENSDTNFIGLMTVPNEKWPEKGMNRLTQYKLNYSNKRHDYCLIPSVYEKSFYTKKTLRAISKLTSNNNFSFLPKIFRKRKIPKNLNVYGGHQWWAFTTSTVISMLEFLKANSWYYSYFTDTLLPDEIFFQTLIMKLLSENKISGLIMPEVTYINWDRPNVPLPVTFTSLDFNELCEQEDKLFARKFSYETDMEIFDKIDKKNSKT